MKSPGLWIWARANSAHHNVITIVLLAIHSCGETDTYCNSTSVCLSVCHGIVVIVSAICRCISSVNRRSTQCDNATLRQSTTCSRRDMQRRDYTFIFTIHWCRPYCFMTFTPWPSALNDGRRVHTEAPSHHARVTGNTILLTHQTFSLQNKAIVERIR